jgi:hypothetical protein
MVIFVCGLITGALLERPAGPRPETTLEAAGAAMTATNPIASAPTYSVVTKTNVVWASAQTQRVALLRQLVNRLHLQPEQRTRILDIIKESQERSRGIWEQIAPQMRDELKRTTEDIRSELSPEQQRHFNEMLREHRRENRARQLGTNSPPFHAGPREDTATNRAPVQ